MSISRGLVSEENEDPGFEILHLSFRKRESTHLYGGPVHYYIGNIVFGGLIGLLIVDPATGAMYKLPETTAATLQPNNTSAAHESQLNVMDIAAVPANIQSQLQRIN